MFPSRFSLQNVVSTAGTVAADTDNGIGVAGVAGGTRGTRGISLMTSTCFGRNGISGSFAEALVYGADNGAHISSNSWGFTSPDVIDSAVREAIDYATNMGVLVVFAAGNDGSDENYDPGKKGKLLFYPGIGSRSR